MASEAHTFVLCKYLIGSFFIMAFIPFRLTLIIIINNVILLASFISTRDCLLASINLDMLVCQNMHICVYVGEKQLIIALA